MVIPKTIRVPEKLYIQSLIAGGMTPQMIIDELNRLKIDVPTNDMAAIVDEVRNVVPDLRSFDEITLDALGLSPMYYYRFQKAAPSGTQIHGCEGALKMLEDPQLRKVVLALTIAGINPVDVELLINGRYHISYESQDIQSYIRYFSNFEEWSYGDREFYISNIKSAEFKMILKKAALKGDRHYLVWKLGLGTDPNMSLEQIFSDMLADSYFTFKENIQIRPDDAQKFAQLAIRLSDRIEQSESKKKETRNFAEELRITLVTDSTQTGDQVIQDTNTIKLEIPKKTVRSTNLEGVKFE